MASLLGIASRASSLKPPQATAATRGRASSFRMSFVSLTGDGPLCPPLWTQPGAAHGKRERKLPCSRRLGPHPATVRQCVCDGVVVARPCVFCAIVSGEIPASFVLREPAACAFLDARPVFKGHVHVVPHLHVDDLHMLSSGDMGPFWSSVQRV